MTVDTRVHFKTPADLFSAVMAARRGEVIEYADGYIARDRAHSSIGPIAHAAMVLSEDGNGALVQRKLADDRYAYLFIRSASAFRVEPKIGSAGRPSL